MSSFYGNSGVDKNTLLQIAENTNNIGNLSELNTTAKDNLVAAINQAAVEATAVQEAIAAAETAEDAAESVEGKAAQIDQNTADISQLKSHLDAMTSASASDEGKALIAKTVTDGQVTEWEFGEAGGGSGAPEIVCTASGVVASFADGADGYAVKGLVVNVEPVQNLHGMPYPYPSGGSKNLIPDGTDTNNGYVAGRYINQNGTTSVEQRYYVSEYFPVTAGETYTWSANVASNNAAICFYNSEKEYLSGIPAANALPKTFTAPEGAAYARSSQGTLASERIFQLETGSTATTPMLYTNICPISGRTAVSVWRTGENLFDNEKWSNAENYPVVGNYDYKLTDPIYLAPNTTYTIKPTGSGTVSEVSYYCIRAFNAENNYTETRLINSGAIVTVVSFTTSDTGIVRLAVNARGDTTAEKLAAIYAVTQFQMEVGSTATAFEPYSGQTVQIPLGQTVYGCRLDVTSGEMVVDRAYVEYDGSADEAWTRNAGRAGFAITPTIPTKGMNAWAISNMFVQQTTSTGTGIYTASTGDIIAQQVVSMLPDSSVASWTAYLAEHPLEVCYEMAQPLTVQLVGQSLTTLKGTNNIWSDGGDVSVDYVADTKLYIEQLTEPDADMVADANIVSGKYFMVGNNLYKATVNIAKDAAIVPGMNCTKTNLAAALNEINS